MPFPDSPRIIYKKNPLVEVLCQVQFSTLLRIESEKPTAFQEAIYENYPSLEEKESLTVEVSTDDGIVKKQTKPIYEFSTEDGVWKVILASDTLTLQTLKYTQWEEFSGRLGLLIDALQEIYRPKFYSRIGLRYKDIIKRSILGLDDKPWNELLNPAVVGVLGNEDIHDDLTNEVNGRFVVALNNGKKEYAHVQHGLVVNKETSEQCYLIDADFFVDAPTEIGNTNDILSTFNRKSGRLFRWCITQSLHESMEPETPD
ncbi:MAG: TIGR04255 family protein [Gammaproteobacteria bacterium]|nr:TIGR04255 family protein [Gammaproteobacteria bacterium]